MIVALDGAPAARLKVNVFTGMSPSDAEFVNVSSEPSVTVLLATAVSVGVAFVSKTITMNVCVALRLGVPLSVTMTLMIFVPGP